jgi:hypothetical protein
VRCHKVNPKGIEGFGKGREDVGRGVGVELFGLGDEDEPFGDFDRGGSGGGLGFGCGDGG